MSDSLSEYAKLKAQIADLQAQADAARQQEVDTAIANIHHLIDEFGLTAADLGYAEVPHRGRQKKRTIPPKYMDPKTGSTWSGRGKPPSWIAGSKNRDAFLIEKQ